MEGQRLQRNLKKCWLKASKHYNAAVVLVGCATTQSPNSPLFDAIKKGDIEAVKKHLDAGADVNKRNRVRPGTFALLTKRGGVGRAMLGLNPKVTPLDFAISTKNPQAAGLFLQNSSSFATPRTAQPSASTSNGPTPTAPSRTLTRPFAPAYNQPCNDPT